MLTPRYLDQVPKHIVKIYEELEDFIIKDICRRISKAGKVTATAERQIYRAREIGIYTEVLKKKIAETLNKSIEEVDKIFKEASIKSTNADNAIYENAKLTPIHLNTSPELQKYLLGAVKQTEGELKNIARSLGFCVRGANGKVRNKKLTDMYIEVLDLVQFQVSNGILDYNTAVRQAVKKITSSGVRYINYESGWSNHVDVAVRRATVSGVNAMAGQMTDFTMRELGVELVEVTAHAGARPDHAIWQGKVYARYKGNSKYRSLEEATAYGQGKGLCGWNCRHNFFPYIEGTAKAWNKEELNNIDNPPIMWGGKKYSHYEATQYQRKLETSMRAVKRDMIGFDSANLREEFTEARVKLIMIKREYNAFSKKAKLPTQYERTQVQGFGRSISHKK